MFCSLFPVSMFWIYIPAAWANCRMLVFLRGDPAKNKDGPSPSRSERERGREGGKEREGEGENMNEWERTRKSEIQREGERESESKRERERRKERERERERDHTSSNVQMRAMMLHPAKNGGNLLPSRPERENSGNRLPPFLAGVALRETRLQNTVSFMGLFCKRDLKF